MAENPVVADHLKAAGHPGDSVFDRVERAWDDRTHKMDWLGMERAIRDLLRYAGARNDVPVAGCIDEIQAAFTKRGHVLR